MEKDFRVPTLFHCARITAGQATAWRHDCVAVQVPLLHVSAVKGLCRSGNDARSEVCRWIWKLVKHSCLVVCVGPAWMQAAQHIAAACLSHPHWRSAKERLGSLHSTVPQFHRTINRDRRRQRRNILHSAAQREPGDSFLSSHHAQPQND